MVSLIVAASENDVIGKNNKLPWHMPADLRYFKNTTWGLPVVMGRKTFESMRKPLPGRDNIVISRNDKWSAPGVRVIHEIPELSAVANDYKVKEIFVIGGAEIFNAAMQEASRIYLTRIHATFEGDVFFKIPEKNWKKTWFRECKPDEKNIYPYTFEVWEKKN